MDVNFIAHFNGWIAKVQNDNRLNTTHICLYLALFQFWNLNRFRTPISVARAELMQVSKIGSVNTYTKCMKDLHQWGYINYQPSHNPLKGSLVNMYYFGKSHESNHVGKQTNHVTKGVNEDKDYSEPL